MNIKLIATTAFKHARVQFEKGLGYEVPLAVGGYFVHNGWAREPNADEAGVECALIEGAQLDHNAPRPRDSGENITIEVKDVAHVTAADLGLKG